MTLLIFSWSRSGKSLVCMLTSPSFLLHCEQNSAIASGLRILLARNKALKLRLKEAGLGEDAGEDEWDTWDEDMVSSFYRKYVFCK